MHKTIAVIGHVDHGKTALVEALTGTKTDTLPEERARGLTINLGFAHMQSERGTVHLVDAPGHADFIRTTVSGLSGVDAVLLVISAKAGIEAQTREHLRLARLLGIDELIIALTMCDLVDDDALARRRQEINTFLAEAFLPAPIVACSTRSADGTRDLSAVLQSVLARSANRIRLPGFFLPIDRVFTSAGAGTIITGTLIGGAVEIGTEAAIGDETFIVRGLQVAGRPVETATPGTRVALNLRGLVPSAAKKGDVAHATNAFAASTRLDVVLRWTEGPPPALKHMDHVIMLAGTGHVSARVRLLAEADDGSIHAQLEPRRPVVTYRGQPLVLRHPASSRTICGGEILDPLAPPIRGRKPLHVAVLHAARSRTPTLVAHALADRDKGEVTVRDMARLCGLDQSHALNMLGEDFRPISDTHTLRRADIHRAGSHMVQRLAALHQAHPIRPSHAPDAIRAAMRQTPQAIQEAATSDLIASGAIRAIGTGLALADHDPAAAMTPDQARAYAALATRLREMGLRPQTLIDEQCGQPDQDDLIALLIHNGTALRLYNHALNQHILLHVDAVRNAEKTLRARFSPGSGFTTGEARDTLATNRKTIVPLLEYMDEQGVTRRDGDLRFLVS